MSLYHGGCQVDDQGQHHQDGGDGESYAELTLFLGVHIQCHGEGCTCAVQSFPEAVQSVGKASGEQQSGGLAQDTAHGQDAAGDDTVRMPRHLPAPRPKAPSR